MAWTEPVLVDSLNVGWESTILPLPGKLAHINVLHTARYLVLRTRHLPFEDHVFMVSVDLTLRLSLDFGNNWRIYRILD